MERLNTTAQNMKYMPNIVKTDGYFDYIYGAEMGAHTYNPLKFASSWEDRPGMFEEEYDN